MVLSRCQGVQFKPCGNMIAPVVGRSAVLRGLGCWPNRTFYGHVEGLPRLQKQCGHKKLISVATRDTKRRQGPSQEQAALMEAREKITLLMQQVSVVDQLRQHMAAQDAQVIRLQQQLAANASDQAQQQASSTRIKELEAALKDMEQKLAGRSAADPAQLKDMQQQLQEQQKAAAQQMESLTRQLQGKDQELLAMKQKVAEAAQQQAALQLQAVTARAEAQAAAATLARALQQQAALEAEASKAAGGKGGGKKGFGAKTGSRRKPAAAAAAAPAPDLQLQQQATSLRQALDESQADVEALRAELQRREEALAAADRSLETLAANFKEQAVKLTMVTSEASQLQQQLEGLRQQREQDMQQQAAAASAAAPPASSAPELKTLRKQLQESQAAEASAKADAAKFKQEMDGLQSQLKAMQQEVDSLAAARSAAEVEVESLRSSLSQRQDDAMEALEQQLQGMSMDMDEVYGLRSDLQILADAFQEKEAEVAKLQAAAQGAEQRQEQLRGQLEQAQRKSEEAARELAEAKQQLQKLQSSVSALEASSTRLSQEAQQLQAALRSKDQAPRSAQGKASGSAAVASNEEVTALKAQLLQKTKALGEAGDRLRQLEQSLASAESVTESLSEELEEQRRGSLVKAEEAASLAHELHILRAEIEDMSHMESSLMSEAAAVSQGEAELKRVTEQLYAVMREKQELNMELERSLKEVEDLHEQLHANEERRQSDLTDTIQTMGALSTEVQTLQHQMANSKGLTLASVKAAAQAGETGKALQEAQAQMVALRAALVRKESELATATQQKGDLRRELESLATQVSRLSQELVAARQEAEARGRQAGVASSQASQAEAALAELQAELAREVQKTQELLAQAEWLVLKSASEKPEGAGAAGNVSAELQAASEHAAAASARAAQLESQVAELQAELSRLQEQVTAQRNTATTEKQDAAMLAVVTALRERVRQLEELGQEKAEAMAELEHMVASSNLGELSAKVEALQAENYDLRQLNIKQQQLLNQTRLFLQGRTGTPPTMNGMAVADN